MKHCKVLIEPIAEIKEKKKVSHTDNKVVHVEKEQEKDPEVEMMLRRRWTKEVNKLTMRWFYHSDPTRRGYRKRIIVICGEIETFEITEQRLVDHARVIRRKILTPRDGEEK